MHEDIDMRIGAKERFEARYAEVTHERAMSQQLATTDFERQIAEQVVKDAGAFGFGAAGLFAGAVAAVRILNAPATPTSETEA